MCYTTVACFPFEPLEKCTTFEDIFPGLSRTLSFNFQDQSDFPGLSRSWNFQEEKIKDFPGLSRRRGNPDDTRMTSDNSGIGTFRSRLKTHLFTKAYAALRICNPAPLIRLPILALYKLILD